MARPQLPNHMLLDQGRPWLKKAKKVGRPPPGVQPIFKKKPKSAKKGQKGWTPPPPEVSNLFQKNSKNVVKRAEKVGRPPP